MSVLFHAFMGVILLCSMAGYMLCTREILKLKTEFIPVIIFSSLTCAVFFCGLLQILFAGAIIILTAGLALFGYYIIQYGLKKWFLKIRISLFQGMFFVGSLFFMHLLSISRLTHYDNFSHWAVVLKLMLSTDAFPTVASKLIDFKNYPLGSTSFLYYICRFAGHSQQVMLIAQGLLIFSCFYAIFGIIEEKKRFLLYGFLGAGCSILSIFNITVRINNLLVDFLLPIYTLVLLVIAYRYRKSVKKACIGIVPIAGMLMIIKNTGIIYAVIGLIYLVVLWIKNKETQRLKSGLYVVGTITASFFPYLLWIVHLTVRFQGVDNKFEISADQLNSVSGGKSPEEVRQIISLFIHSVFDMSTRPAMGVFVFHFAAIGAIIFAAVVLKKKWSLWKALVSLDIVLILYYIGILGLYIFSMPSDEAVVLAGFERYASSIVVLFAGGLTLCATVDLEGSFYYKLGSMPDYRAFKSIESKDRYQKGIIVTVGLSIALLMSEYSGMKTIQQSYQTTLPYKVQQVTGDRWYKGGKEDESRYLFYASDKDSQVTNYFLQYVGKYMLYAPNVDGICAFYEDNMTNLLSGYDYLVIVESDLPARYLLNKHYGVTGKEGIYRIESYGEEGKEKRIKLVLMD